MRRAELDQELEAELEFHIAREAEKYERQGVPAAEARRRARLAFGGPERVKEESRDARGTALLESVLQDTRYALRGLRAKPGFAVGVGLTLALGIGANATMFGIVDRLLFRPPAYLRDVVTIGLERTDRAVEGRDRAPRSPGPDVGEHEEEVAIERLFYLRRLRIADRRMHAHVGRLGIEADRLCALSEQRVIVGAVPVDAPRGSRPT